MCFVSALMEIEIKPLEVFFDTRSDIRGYMTFSRNNCNFKIQFEMYCMWLTLRDPITTVLFGSMFTVMKV